MKASILNKLNCKTQAHAKVCKENSEAEKNNCPLKYFVVKGLTSKAEEEDW